MVIKRKKKEEATSPHVTMEMGLTWKKHL